MLCGCAHQQKVATPYPRWGEEIVLASSGQSAPMTLRVLPPSRRGKPAACILLVHGMNEYIGRYEEIARHFSQHYLVSGFDLYGHGLSNPVIAAADAALAQGAAEADVSRAYQAQAGLRTLEPMREGFGEALRSLLQRCPDKPLFVLSHSLGSLVAASFLLERQEDESLKGRIGGIVLLAPAFSVPDIPGRRGRLANPVMRLSFFAESHFLNRQGETLPLSIVNQAVAVPVTLLVRGLFEALSWPGIRVLATPVTPDWVPDYLTDWEEERARHRADGYIIRRSLLRYVKAVEREIVGFRRRMGEFRLPYLLVYSGQDPITASWGMEDFLRASRANHPDNESMLLPDRYPHEHLFSSPPLREEILRRIDAWLARRLIAGP